MRLSARIVLPLLALLPLAGCNFAMRRTLDDPGRSQTVRVESGERLYFDLDEDPASECRWRASCADSDVLVKIKHVPGKARVEVRIHRGYDGPSDVEFRYSRLNEKTPVKQFTLALFRRTGDCAFWE